MSRSDAELIGDALEHLRVLHLHLERGDLADVTVADAVALRLAAAIESIASASEELRDRTCGKLWPSMWATRNRIAHGYAFVDLRIIRLTVERDVPAFESALRSELPPINPGPLPVRRSRPTTDSARRFLGVDLAWGEGTPSRAAKETGVAMIDESGTVLDAGWRVGVDATVEWLADSVRPGDVIAIDAPLVIPNATGMRACEKQVGSAYGRAKVAANASNQAMGWQAGVAVRDRLEALGFVYADGISRPPADSVSFFECYPYTVIVGSPELDYAERPRYKRKPKKMPAADWRTLRAAECDELISRVAALANANPPVDLASHPVTRALIDDPSPIQNVPYKHREDLFDAVLSAWCASIWATDPARVQILGADADERDDDGRLATIIAPARGWQRLSDRFDSDHPSAATAAE